MTMTNCALVRFFAALGGRCSLVVSYSWFIIIYKMESSNKRAHLKRMLSSSGFIQGSERLDMRLLHNIFLEVHLCNIPLGVNVAEDAAFPHRVDEYLLSKATLLRLNLDNENNA